MRGSSSAWLRIGVILGLVVIATGLFSLSAFSSTSFDRSANITVVADDTGPIALLDGHPDSGLIEQQNNGILEIDFTRGGASGANSDSTFYLGDGSNPVSNHAFRILNQGRDPVDVMIGYSLTTDSGESSGTKNLVFTLHYDANADDTIDSTTTVSENTGNDSTSVSGVAVGELIYVTITLDTSGLSSTNDLSGTLTVDATAV